MKAQQAQASSALQLFYSQVQGGQALDDLLKTVDSGFAEIGTGNDTISEADIAIHKAMRAASMRGLVSSELLLMDIDNDGFITRNEIERWYD